MARRAAGRIEAARRWSRPGVEGLESRQLMALVLADQFTGGASSGSVTQPYGIVDGPDGNLWFIQNSHVTSAGLGGGNPSTASVGEIDPTTGAVSTFELAGTPGNNRKAVGGIAVGPDENLWFTVTSGPAGGEVGMINPTTHAIAEFPVNGGTSSPQGIAGGSDGNLWFTDGGKIGRINPTTHAIKEFPLPNAYAGSSAIVAGPDGNLWFTEQDTAGNLTIGKIDPTSLAITEYKTSTTGGSGSMTVGPDHKLWFTGSGDQIGVIDPATGDITELPIPDANVAYPERITAGPDGNLYFTERLSNSFITRFDAIGEVNPTTHTFSIYPIIPALPELLEPTFAPRSIVTGPDGNLWATAIGEIDKILIVPANQAVIRSNVYSDPNQDGTFSGGPLAQREVYLDLKKDGRLDPGDPTIITGPDGYYTFLGLAPGTYTVRLVTYPGDTATGTAGVSQVVTAGGGQVVPVYTFGVASMSAVLPMTWSGAPFGSHNPDVSTAEVNGLYRTILGRAPDAVGGAAAVAALKGGTPLSQIASNLLHSAEYDNALAASDYESYLGRAASPAELAYVAGALQGGLSPEQLAGDLLGSAEFSLIHVGDADFLTAAYGDTLGRAISATELSAVEALIAGGLGRAAVVDSLLASAEADQRAANGFARVFLGTTSDPNLAASIKALQSGTSLTALATAFASGPAFVTRANATVG